MLFPMLWTALAYLARCDHPRLSKYWARYALSATSALVLVQSMFLIVAVNSASALSASDYSALMAATTADQFCERYAALFDATSGVDSLRGLKHQWLLPMSGVRRGIVNYVAMDSSRWSPYVPINPVSMIDYDRSKQCSTQPR